MASSSSRVGLPANLEDVPIEHLIHLIGDFNSPSLTFPSHTFPADMLDRLMAHNDQIPLSPYIIPSYNRPHASLIVLQGEFDSLPL